MPFVLALDQGTTSSRALVFDHGGAVRGIAQREFRQIYPEPGWVEHDPTEIWGTQSGVMHEALAKAGIAGRDVAAIGITNQRETTLLWERATGRVGVQWELQGAVARRDFLKSRPADKHAGRTVI
jgi:glycerol kinase